MERLDQYEQIAGADKSLGKHPLIQVTVELARELGKNSVCMANNKCDISEFAGKPLPKIWPRALDTIFKEVPAPSAGPKKKDRTY
ncbi:hypothetical protein [Pseudomonas sp. RIT-PI-AD]|uniref:hypothetical protein n=1 Tax=Pseudomonas sp. RIT-PI-AD TaxID=3035294 RepID=UPI0021D8D30F|nr:hypothetical protein [Pseudomonas sp. RIT-PI-AD]